MFKSTFFSPNTITSDEGFRLYLVSRKFVLYKRGNLRLQIQIEGDTRKDVFWGSAEVPKTGERLLLPPELEKLVYDDVRRALEWKGFVVRVV